MVAVLRDPSKPDESPRIVLQKQWRPPINATVIEVPAGLMDPNESPETCALRELKEESGYVGEVMQEGFGVSPIMFNGELTVAGSFLFFLYLLFWPWVAYKVDVAAITICHGDLSLCLLWRGSEVIEPRDIVGTVFCYISLTATTCMQPRVRATLELHKRPIQSLQPGFCCAPPFYHVITTISWL